MKKLISVLLCIVVMFTFLTVISSAADGTAEEANEFWGFIQDMMTKINWAQILSILVTTITTIVKIFTGA